MALELQRREAGSWVPGHLDTILDIFTMSGGILPQLSSGIQQRRTQYILCLVTWHLSKTACMKGQWLKTEKAWVQIIPYYSDIPSQMPPPLSLSLCKLEFSGHEALADLKHRKLISLLKSHQSVHATAIVPAHKIKMYLRWFGRGIKSYFLFVLSTFSCIKQVNWVTFPHVAICTTIGHLWTLQEHSYLVACCLAFINFTWLNGATVLHQNTSVQSKMLFMLFQPKITTQLIQLDLTFSYHLFIK